MLVHETCNDVLDDQDKQAKFRTVRAIKASNKRWANQGVGCYEHATSNHQAMLGHAIITETVTVKKVSKDTIIAPDDVSGDVWSDVITHRKTKKSPVTKTAIDGIRREATKAGISLQDAIVTIVNRR